MKTIVKHNYCYTWILLFAFYSCVASAQKKSEKNPSALKGDTIIKKRVSNYREKKISPIIYSNDTLQIAYFEDSINNMSCSMYLKTDLEIVDSIGTPLNHKEVLGNLKNKDVVLLVNNEFQKLNVNIRDYNILLPTSIACFRFNDEDYLLVNSHLISFMSGNFWSNLLLKIDSKGNVINQYCLESNDIINQERIGDYNNDNILDYYTENNISSNNGKKNNKQIIIYSIE